MTRTATEKGTHLERTLGLPGLSFFGVGMILGAGIYSVIGAAAEKAGDALWMSFVFGAAAALFTGLSYAELGTMYPRAGAEFVYVRKAFPKLEGAALACAVVIVLAAAATAATVALAFSGYFVQLVDVPRHAVAFALLVAVSLVNMVGLRHSMLVTVVFTLIEGGGLLAVVALGMTRETFGEALASSPRAGVLAGAALVFFAYLGFEEIVNLAEEAKTPGRDLPRAIFLSLGLTTLLYVLVALAAVALVPPEELAASESPLAAAAGRAWAPARRALAAVALFATANTALATLLTASRMVFGMARAGDLPGALARVLPGHGTPWVASLAVLAIAAAFVPLGGVALVAGLSSFGALVAFVVVNACAVVLRRTDPDRERPFRIQLAIAGVPVLPCLGVLTSLALLVSFDSDVYLGGAAALVLAVGLAVSRRWWKRSGGAGPARRPAGG